MAYGILFVRVVLGATMFGHGAQKLFGWFDGHGPPGTAGFFGSLGFRRPLAMAVIAGTSEASGILLALGFLTPLACLAIASVMVVAVGSVHRPKGFWVMNGGYEYNLLIWASAVAITMTGPGRFSIDRALGWVDNYTGLWWGLGVAIASLIGGGMVLAARERQPEPEAADASLAREREDERIIVQ
jgi:putative oxidoreductase